MLREFEFGTPAILRLGLTDYSTYVRVIGYIPNRSLDDITSRVFVATPRGSLIETTISKLHEPSDKDLAALTRYESEILAPYKPRGEILRFL